MLTNRPKATGRLWRRAAMVALCLVALGFAALTVVTAHREVTQLLDHHAWQAEFAPTMPSDETTGVPPDRSLQILDQENVPYAGDTFDGVTFTINTPGAVYEGWEFQHLVDVAAPDVVFRDCLFRGATELVRGAALLKILNERQGPTGVPSAMVSTSTFLPRYPNRQLDGVRGSNFTLDRVEITQTVDGAHIYGTRGAHDDAGNVRIVKSWIHDLTHFDDKSHRDGSHNDGVQIVGGRDIAIVASRIDGEIYNAAVMVTQDRSAVGNVSLAMNWLAGGACTVNIWDGGKGIKGVRLQGNAFLVESQRKEGCGVTISSASLEKASESGSHWLQNWS